MAVCFSPTPTAVSVEAENTAEDRRNFVIGKRMIRKFDCRI